LRLEAKGLRFEAKIRVNGLRFEANREGLRLRGLRV
jgi:hypothetical protein